nr:isoform 2 of u4/u6 small nuclear ribonucleoprotein prp4 [Quercus suber]
MSVHPSRQAYVDEAAGETVDLDSIQSIAAVPSEQANSLLTEFARRREAARVAVPTDDKRVRADLRARGEPITLFGERPEDRRDRLRALLYAVQGSGAGDTGEDDDTEMQDEEEAKDDEEGEFFSRGTHDLLLARRDMAEYSIPRAKRRLAYQRRESALPVSTHVKHRKAVKERLQGFELFGSQIASERPMSIVRFSPNGEILAAGDWNGSIKLLDVPYLETTKVLRGHKQMIGGLSWYPGATLPESSVAPTSVNLASTGGEGDIHLWSLNQDTPIATLSGHNQRVCRTEFHPSGKYLASASYDTTWRLWDVATTTELMLQEGHSKEVYTVSFNEDGSLIASAGLDSIGRVWDLRSGRVAMILDTHVGPIHALDWGPDGYRVMTGSADGFAKCWDLRAIRESASIGAHRGGVSDLRWYKGSDGPLSSSNTSSSDAAMTNGDADKHTDTEDADAALSFPKKSGTFFISSGFDKAVNVFSADDWALCKSLMGHDGIVLAADVTMDAKWIASCGRDRTVKLWARDDTQAL